MKASKAISTLVSAIIVTIVFAAAIPGWASDFFEDDFNDGSFNVPTDWGSGSGVQPLVLTPASGRVNVGAGVGGNAKIATDAINQSTKWNGSPVAYPWVFSFDLEVPSTYNVAGLVDNDVTNYEFLRLDRTDGSPQGIIGVFVYDIVGGDAQLRLFNNYYNFSTGTENFVTVTRDVTHQVALQAIDASTLSLVIDGTVVATQSLVAGALPNRIRLGDDGASDAGEVWLDNSVYKILPPKGTVVTIK